ncbi:allantoate amidohydrolase [Marinimicrococcus flavescens]|uniref:Allantoate amidohydrolase n=1 Tax=Marinimicrococcus flavescens TaxID=3031815 RepID=A0AAP3UZG2_9PROT|nr:allantoate amidohydrolase [Marinimicrococcus flavescens]
MTAAVREGRIARRLEALAAISDEPGRLTRLYLSPAHGLAMRQVRAWMEEAGMTTRIDAVGNVMGRYEGSAPGAPCIMLGSHIDTVVDAGRFDGTLGVLAGIEVVDALRRAGELLPVAVEVIAFGDEEGVRFPTTLTGSRAVAGTLDPGVLDVRDGDGTSVRDALLAVGADPEALAACARGWGEVAAYLEAHIEQGPVLEAEDLPVGVVTAINGAARLRVEVTGEAGHAGTVPMGLRRDALAAAAEMVLAIERLAHGTLDLVATVGRLEALPGAVNVIPGGARFTIDLRSPEDTVRTAALAQLGASLREIAARRGVGVALELFHETPAVACDARLVGALAQACTASGSAPRLLPSGAGHDAMAMAALCPVGMLFVRCRGGISHNPAEWAEPADMDRAVAVLLHAVRALAAPPSQSADGRA